MILRAKISEGWDEWMACFEYRRMRERGHVPGSQSEHGVGQYRRVEKYDLTSSLSNNSEDTAVHEGQDQS
jgi:hypothetical protein